MMKRKKRNVPDREKLTLYIYIYINMFQKIYLQLFKNVKERHFYHPFYNEIKFRQFKSYIIYLINVYYMPVMGR